MTFRCCGRAICCGSLLLITLVAILDARASADTLTISGSLSSSIENGAALGAGSYTEAQLSAAGAAIGTVTSGGLTGVPLWSLLGGTSAGSSDVSISTPLGDNGKNSILRSYIVATSISGVESVISLGEIDPFFGGTGATPDFIAFRGTDGQAELVFPAAGASGRNIIDLSSLQVLVAPALLQGAENVPSPSLAFTGNVAHPGNYNLAQLQALSSTSQTVTGDTYTGVPLWAFLNHTSSNILNQLVISGGTDGYEVVYSLAELDPALGAPADLLPYADTQGQFPADGVARIVIPGDNHQGRWVSNVNSLEVTTIPEPATAFLLAAPLLALCLMGFRLNRHVTSAVASHPSSTLIRTR